MGDCLPPEIVDGLPSEDHEPERPRGPRELVTELLEELVAALLNSRIYFLDHPRVNGSLARIAPLIREIGEEAVKLSIVGDFLVFQQRPLLSATLSSKRLIEALTAWEAGGLEISRKTTIPEIQALIEVMLTRPQVGEGFETANAQLDRIGFVNLRLLPVFTRGKEQEIDEAEIEEAVLVPVKLYQSMIDVLESVTLSVCQNGRIRFGPVQDHAEEVLKRLESEEGSLLNLARHEQYDAFTFGHSVRVAVLAMNFGRALTANHDALVRLGTAALLHDVGKSLIPFEILHSRGKLSDEDRAEINKHPDLGAKILIDHRDADPLAVAAAFGHHKTIEHQGYPDTAHEHQLSAITHIVKVCDTYEALTAARPYKKPMGPIRAYRIMMDMKGHFHPQFLRRFIEVNGVYPNGQLIRLDDGRKARVTRQSPVMLEPIVTTLTDPEGNPLTEEDRETIDLSYPGDAPEVKVLEALAEGA
jgi:HD-GYP domain-containing protein (c-di-GMP phosphodiesterase class II)